ncbi:MAG TPA: hypothetical protein VHP63_01595 [candidate division Zixibacteria bacterium]|nr:hypothetical protein [candidate division Zixibacteria bacterium]
MNKIFRNIGIVSFFALLQAATVLGQNNHANGNGNGRSAVLKINPAENAWTESHLSEKLMAELSRNGNGEIIRAEALVNSMSQSPSEIYSTGSLSIWGMESGKRYLVIVNIESEGPKKKKTFKIPLVVSKYEHVRVVVGELRIIDATRRKVVLAEQFTFEKEAKRIFQGSPDDDINDADLHISAPGKFRFFSELEFELAKELAKKIRNATSLR